MTRIYHTWEKWECYPAGMYETTAPNGMTGGEANETYRQLLVDTSLFERTLLKVLRTWPKSCEHYLSNEKMNRIAWLGQAALCVHAKVPRCFRGGFNLLTEREKREANEAALRALNIWLKRRGEQSVTMEQAGVNSEVDLY